jgi:L-lactate dehydrogenase (cytochrome)
MLDIFAREMRVAMTLTGVTSIDQIDETTLVQAQKLSDLF